MALDERQEDDDDDEGSPLFTPPDSPNVDPVHSNDQEDVAELLVGQQPIPGLFYLADIISEREAEQLIDDVSACEYFDVERGRDQAVLFGSPDVRATTCGLPRWACSLLNVLENRLYAGQEMDRAALDIVFARKPSTILIARQLILNTYRPAQGIATHIDLPHRFLDGIMILSLGSGISMDFTDDNNSQHRRSFYLLPRSLCVLTGESRWQWKHGIAARPVDRLRSNGIVQNVPRGLRLSITIRWLYVQQEEDGMMMGGSMNGDLRV